MTSPSTDSGNATPRWQAELENAQRHLERAAFTLRQEAEPPVDLRPTGAAIRRALEALYDAYDLRDDRVSGTRRAIAALDEARNQLEAGVSAATLKSAFDALSKARGHLSQTETILAARPAEMVAERESGLRASSSEPRHHRVQRASLTPRLELAAAVAPPPPGDMEPVKPQTFQELEANIAMLKMRAEERRETVSRKKTATPRPAPEKAAPPAGFGPDIPDVVSELAFVQARTRDLLEEVAMVGMQRAPLLGDPWRVALPLEQRMLRAIDGIASMGAAALEYVERWAMDAPAKDPTRVFGVAMTLGCFAGRDALAAVERVFYDFEQVEPDCRRELVAALQLVPHDLVAVMLRSMLVDSDERHRAAAIEVLGYRRLATEMELATAALDDPVVASAALPRLALEAPKSARDAITEALTSTDTDLVRSAWLAMALSDHPGTTARLRDALDTELADDAARLLALCGDEGDARLLVDRMRATPTRSLISAVGWAGSLTAVPPLIDLLDGDDDMLRIAAAYALDRITGAGLNEEAEVDAEEILVPEPPDPDVGEPPSVKVVRMTSDPRDLPPEPSTETVDRPSTHSAAWRHWWKEQGSELSAGKRYRVGRPYTPQVSLWELDEARRMPVERRMLQHELVIRSGNYVRFDPHDFVSVQEAAIEQWRSSAQRASSQPGSWHRSMRR